MTQRNTTVSTPTPRDLEHVQHRSAQHTCGMKGNGCATSCVELGFGLGLSRRRDCRFDDALSPSLLRHLIKGERGAAE